MSADAPSPEGDQPNQYMVVARRYRPQSFTELVGQQQVAQALGNAIATQRVGHAYLFTGARGVGKTSTARILAKCLNCQNGPTSQPCGECDICQSIASGGDVDVLEIDGASNRGIDEIRQLRSNVGIRPGRARFKIYIIDEVHMLTQAAFNALLKTLEEPPEHVKFFFCTTDPEKIPITVLSRCQRFDFAPVESAKIVERLQYIVENEGVEAEPAALEMLARRAGGSMRDSQSLLEQLLSFGGDKITLDNVYSMLGAAHGGKLAAIAQKLLDRDAAAALGELDAAIRQGVDVGQLGEQLLGYFRDMMAAAAGCNDEMMLHVTPDDFTQLQEQSQKFGLETLLAVVQILDHALVKMRQSTQVRTLIEVALVRICKLEDLDALPAMIAQLRGDAAAPPSRPAAQKKTAVIPPSDRKQPESAPSKPPEKTNKKRENATLDVSQIEQHWKAALAEVGGLAEEYGGNYKTLAISGPNQLAVHLNSAYNKERCEKPEFRQAVENALERLVGRRFSLKFTSEEASAASAPKPPSSSAVRRERQKELEAHPWVQKAVEIFDAEVLRAE